MGCGKCLGNIRAKTVSGERSRLPVAPWDAYKIEDEIEVGGLPLHYYLQSVCKLCDQDASRVIVRLQADVQRTDQARQALRQVSVGSVGTATAFPTKNQVGSICTRQSVRVQVLSWNVGALVDTRQERGSGLEETMKMKAKRLLVNTLGPSGKAEADVIVIGLQEIISLTLDNVFHRHQSDGAAFSDEGWPETIQDWVELLTETINSDGDSAGSSVPVGQARAAGRFRQFVLVGQPVYLFGLLLCVFCVAELVGTELLGFNMFQMPADSRASGVKGAVACRFSLHDRSFCFVNCHLSADKSKSVVKKDKAFQDRMKQIAAVCEKIGFQRGDQMVYPLKSHRAVFFFGDTNMRLFQPAEYTSFDAFQEHVLQEIAAGNSSKLWVHDQLCQILGNSLVPETSLSMQRIQSVKKYADEFESQSWREPCEEDCGPDFKPTFKLSVPGTGYDKKRVPAWTDRILFRSKEVKALAYRSVNQMDVMGENIADHDPVTAVFEVNCVRVRKGGFMRLLQQARGLGTDDETSKRRLGAHVSSPDKDFRWRVANSAQPHLQQLARRLLSIIRKINSESQDKEPPLSPTPILMSTKAAAGGDPLVGNTEFIDEVAECIVEAQDECWDIVCDLVLARFQDAIARSRSESPSGEVNIKNLQESLVSVLDELRDLGGVQPSVPSQPSASSRPSGALSSLVEDADSAERNDSSSLHLEPPADSEHAADLPPFCSERVQVPDARLADARAAEPGPSPVRDVRFAASPDESIPDAGGAEEPRVRIGAV